MGSSVSLKKCIAPSFYGIHNEIKSYAYTHYWFKGGRGSTKSSFVSIEIVLWLIRHKDSHALCLRRYANTLGDSVYAQIEWAIEKLGVADEWRCKTSPLEMENIITGQKIYFRGADKPKSIKSIKPKFGYIGVIWYEELDEFENEDKIDTINQSAMRGGSKVAVFYTYNPPQERRNWVNVSASTEREGRRVHASTYLTVPKEWLGEVFLIEAERKKRINNDKYRHQYLGEEVGTGAEVFINVRNEKITDEDILSFANVRRGIDWGYAADPFVYLAMNYDPTRKRLYIFYEYYKVNASFDRITEAIKKENVLNRSVTADSAEPRSNQNLNDRGLKIRPAKKGAGSVESGVKWLQDLEEIVIDAERCPNAWREFSTYELARDARGEFKEGYPDKDNHTIDAVRYALEDDMPGMRKTITTIGGLYI